MKSWKHYRYEARIAAVRLSETACLGLLLAARSVLERFREAPSEEEEERENERARREAILDEQLKETFPASDPPAHSIPPRR